MKIFISFLLIAALIASIRSEDDCDQKETCPLDSPEVCVLHPTLYCFIKYENLCIWKEVKCKFNLNYKEYDIKYCSLENFKCRHNRNHIDNSIQSYNS